MIYELKGGFILKRYIALFVSFLCIVLSSGVNVCALSAYSYAVYSPESDEFILENNADEQLSMASTTKIMTALLTAEYIEKYGDKTVTVTNEMILVEGSALGLREGDKITLSALVAGMLLASGNDAANTAAIAVAGNTENFAELMNNKAKKLGLNNSSFVTPSGLDAEGHYSTAKDMAKLAAFALENELFSRIAASENLKISYYSCEADENITVSLTNHNKLLSMLEGCIGVKTGYTKKSGRCLVSAVKKDDTTLICVSLNAPDDWNDHIALYDEAFSKRKSYEVKCIGFSILTADGIRKELTLADKSEVYYFGDGEIKEKIYLPRFIYDEADMNFGRVDYILNGKVIETRIIR